MGSKVPTIKYDTRTMYNNEQLYGVCSNMVGFGGDAEAIPSILKDGNHYLYSWDASSTITKNESNLISGWDEKISSVLNMSQPDNTRKLTWTKEGAHITGTGVGMQISPPANIKHIYVTLRWLTWADPRRPLRRVPITGAQGTIFQSGISPNLRIFGQTALVGNIADLPVGDWGVLQYTINGASSFLRIDNKTKVNVDLGTSTLPGIAFGNPNDVAVASGLSPEFMIKDIVISTVVDSDENASIIFNYLNTRKNKIVPKLVTLGDSITFQELWQSYVYTQKNLAYSSKETVAGVGTYKKMGQGGSRLIPLYDGTAGHMIGDSIYERADFVNNYYPTIVTLFGGTNDFTYTLGTPSDAAYTGTAVSSNPPTFCAAYKGTLEKLINQNPNVKIVCLTPLYNTIYQLSLIQSFVTAILQIGAQYNVQVLDLLNDVPINASNHTTYLSDGVHPNALGGELIGNYIAANI